MLFNQLVQDIHQNAKDKGWYDGTPRSPAEMHMLMISEIAEATEEVRANKPPLYGISKQDGEITYGDIKDMCWLAPDMKPEGEAVELADCVIRIFDYFASNGWDFDAAMKLVLTEAGIESVQGAINNPNAQDFFDNIKSLSPLEVHRGLVDSIVKAYSDNESVEQFELATVVFVSQLYFITKEWNFIKVVELKHNYNKTRPYRHGNKAV